MEILHLIGICPDSFSHVDTLDFLISNYSELKPMVSKINLFIRIIMFKFVKSR